MGNQWKQCSFWGSFILGGSKITTDGDCSHEIKRCLFLGRKVMTNLDSILKSMYGYESWTIRKAERQRIDAFELWCWSRLLSVPWTARRSNQSVLKEISPEYSLERLMLKLKLHTLATWCEELTHWKRPRFWERLKAGGEGDDRGWDGWMASPPTQWIWVWVNSRSWWWTEKPGVLQSMGLQRVRHNWTTELNWRVLRHWWCPHHSLISVLFSQFKSLFSIFPVLFLPLWCRRAFRKLFFIEQLSRGRRRYRYIYFNLKENSFLLQPKRDYLSWFQPWRQS